MCGICGIIDYGNIMSSDRRQAVVLDMNAALIHRGPDGAGHHHTAQSSLAMRRLAIIDCEGGDQPIFNEDGSIAVVFNGEIYNYKSLKKELIELGHTFTTSSDTEVLVHLYESYGKDMIQRLKGMFAFCIHDSNKDQYLLARDRFGEKPLYYHYSNNCFTFSSEITSLLENKALERKLNTDALPYYLRTSLVPEPLTLLAGIYSLKPGSYIEISRSDMQEGRYFIPSVDIDNNIKTLEDAKSIIAPLLEQAVVSQSMSDVPIGAFLSGGIDSSSVVALLQKNNTQPIKTFNVRFEEQTFDESAIAKKVAEHCGTDHHEITIPNFDFEENIFWTIIKHVGLPFRDSSAIPTYLIAQEISQEVKVALSGDGGDELFGGYDLFQWYLKIKKYKGTNQYLRKIALSAVTQLQQMPYLSTVEKLRRVERGLSTTFLGDEEIAISLNEMFSISALKDLYPSLLTGFNYKLLRDVPAGLKGKSSLRDIMAYRLHHTLPSNMLVKVDRMSMAHSLEVRAPFLDVDLFEASSRLPDAFLINNNKGKYIIRECMRSLLPEEVFSHPKSGFNLPLYKFQNKNYISLARKLLFYENPWPELFSVTALEKIYNEGIHFVKSDANASVFQTSHKLWMMMQLFGWAKYFNVKI